MKLLHRHKWTIRQGSGLGHVLNLRYCKCGCYQSQMYDYSKKDSIWVDGNFMEDIASPVFIIAESDEAVKECLPAVPSQGGYYQARTMEDLEYMKKWSHPRFIVGSDYKETAISDLPEFRKLMTVGHF
jgi:hypothetical protein